MSDDPDVPMEIAGTFDIWIYAPANVSQQLRPAIDQLIEQTVDDLQRRLLEIDPSITSNVTIG
jgi:hypothetical protein